MLKSACFISAKRTTGCVVTRGACFAAMLGVSLISLSWSTDASAQPKQPRKGAIVTKTLTAGDGFPIAVTYYESVLGKDASVVILLHMKDRNRRVWKSFAEKLQLRGHAVVTVDLRGHGESVPGGAPMAQGGKVNLRPGDYKNMYVFDLEAVKKFILEEHHQKKLNIRKTAIIAAEMSTPIAAVFAARDWIKKPYSDGPNVATSTPRGQDIRALVLLSPVESVPGVSILKPLIALRTFGVAVMTGHGTGDSLDRNGKTAGQVHELVTNKNAKETITYLQGYPTKLRGTAMLGGRLKVEENMVVFLDKHLNKLTDPWVIRKSRLKR